MSGVLRQLTNHLSCSAQAGRAPRPWTAASRVSSAIVWRDASRPVVGSGFRVGHGGTVAHGAVAPQPARPQRQFWRSRPVATAPELRI